MSIYNDLDLDSILNSSFSAQEGLDDIALEIEDRDKILFNLSQLSRSSTLKVDYSDFKNHVFFGSAYALTNFALYRLYQDYPIFGELKDINEWRRINSGYENWFFDNYPKYTGYLNLLSQSGAPPYVVANDYQGYITNLATSSFTVEFIFSSSNQNDLGRIFEISDAANNNAIEIYYSSSMNFVVAAGGLAALLTCSFAVNTSHHVACVYSYPEQKQYIYIDNLLFASRSTPSLGALNINRPNVNIGASTFAGETFYLYGQLDEFRFWNQDRRPFLAKTFYRGITANHSGGLQLYYKFNESPDVGNKIIDYSGNNIHGFLTGGYSLQTNLISGTILSSFNDSGIPILSLTNSLVSTFVNQQLSAAILYDSNNRNNIFNIVPSYMTDDTIDSEDQQRFLLLIARHYDRLKLSIQHLSNVMYSDERNFNTTPDEFINLVAKHYGLDVSDVYSSSDLSQYFFGENVLTTGSLSTSLLTIKNQLRRNLLNNLIYIIKTKSTRESIQSSLRSLGFNNEAIAVNEYSKLSGGISTTYDQKTVERKVIRFLTSSTLYLTSLAYSFTNTSSFLYEVRAKFLTSSTFVTSSVFHVGTNNGDVNLFVQRENPSSSNAVVKYKSDLLLSSSLLNIWDGNWINFAFGTNFSSSASSLLITKLNGNFLEISGAYFSASRSGGVIGFTASSTGSVWLGSSSSARPFEGYMQEFRAWRDLDLNDQATRTSFINHGKNFESIEVPNFLTDLDKLAIYHKLNDHNFTIISGALIGIHDYVSGTDYKSYLSGSSSFEFNTPGLVIPKLGRTAAA